MHTSSARQYCVVNILPPPLKNTEFRRAYKRVPQPLLRFSRVINILCTTCMDVMNNQELLVPPPGGPLSWLVTIFYPCTLLLHEPWVSKICDIPYSYFRFISLVLPCMHLLCKATFLIVPSLHSWHNQSWLCSMAPKLYPLAAGHLDFLISCFSTL